MTFKWLKIIFSLFIFHLALINLSAQNTVSIDDAIINRVTNTEIPVIGNFSQTGSYNLHFRYNSYIINIDTLVISNNSNFLIDSVKVNYTDIRNTEFVVFGKNIINNNNGILFSLKLIGLAYKDSITYLFLDSVRINSSLNPELKDSALINVKGDITFYPNYRDNLGFAYPNPYYRGFSGGFISFNFTIEDEKESKVTFKLFKLNGTQVASSDVDTDIFQLDDGSDINSILKGFHILRIYLSKYKDSQGNQDEEYNSKIQRDFSNSAYFIVMETERDVLFQKFIIIEKQ